MIKTTGFFQLGHNSMFVKDATIIVSATLTTQGTINCNAMIGTFRGNEAETIENFNNQHNIYHSFAKDSLVFDSGIQDVYDCFCDAIETRLVAILSTLPEYSDLIFTV